MSTYEFVYGCSIKELLVIPLEEVIFYSGYTMLLIIQAIVIIYSGYSMLLFIVGNLSLFIEVIWCYLQRVFDDNIADIYCCYL